MSKPKQKLYVVRFEIDVVVVATDENEAGDIALDNLDEEARNVFGYDWITEVTKPGQVTPDWLTSRPYAGYDAESCEHDVGEIIENPDLLNPPDPDAPPPRDDKTIEMFPIKLQSERKEEP